jgi:hypothetical protein
VSSDGQFVDSAIISTGIVHALTAVQQRNKSSKNRLKMMLQRGEIRSVCAVQESMLLRSVRPIVW